MRDQKIKDQRQLGIYLHIPFCVRKCNYCDFLSAPAGKEIQKKYVECLQEEIRAFGRNQEYQVASVFFGGGTPSILEGEQIAQIMETLQETFLVLNSEKQRVKEEKTADSCLDSDRIPEITVECNPGTLTAEKLKCYRECGINRLSIGLQSAENKELKLLGRIHTWEDFLENYEAARTAGFTNINIDLMSSLPGQTTDSWEETLRKITALKPEHISAYSLIIEEGTPFFEQYGEEDAARARGETPRMLPSEEAEREMYYATDRILQQAGMRRYEISNYALPGKESIHNCGYWRRREYLGFGLGASSQFQKRRYKNTDCLTDYLAGDFSRKEELILSRQDEIEETMFLGLRMMEGVNLDAFRETFGKTAEEIYSVPLKKLSAQGLVCVKDGWLRLTPLGIDVSNGVLAEFLL